MFTPKEPNDLTMSVGDVIDIVEETNVDWWTGRNGGKQGLFPSNYVQKLSTEPSPQPHQEKLYGAPGYNDSATIPHRSRLTLQITHPRSIPLACSRRRARQKEEQVW